MARMNVPKADEGGFEAANRACPHPSPLPHAGEGNRSFAEVCTSCRRLLIGAAAEELGRLERQRTRNDQRRKRLDLRVQIAHRAVVEPPRVLEMILDLDELALQREKAVARL